MRNKYIRSFSGEGYYSRMSSGKFMHKPCTNFISSAQQHSDYIKSEKLKKKYVEVNS